MAIEEMEDACVKSWVVEPVLKQAVQPAIYLPADLDRVTGAIEFSNLQWEMNSLTSSVREHAATIAYRFQNVSIVEGALYSGRWRQRLMARERAEKDSGPENRRPNGVVACSWCGNHFFGHWITDDLPLYLAAQEIGDPLILKRKPFLHEPGYRELLGTWCEQVACTRVDDLVVLRDVGQNSYKRKRYEILRSRLKRKFRSCGAKRVLLRRGRLGTSREIVNAPEFDFIGDCRKDNGSGSSRRSGREPDTTCFAFHGRRRNSVLSSASVPDRPYHQRLHRLPGHEIRNARGPCGAGRLSH
jgi:hypothetical protein